MATIYGTSGNDRLNGTASNDSLIGYAGDDTLIGYGGDDTLQGSSGADLLLGGTGNDIYYVDSAGDVVAEFANAGSDYVYSTINYTLTAQVEIVVLEGPALKATGNSLDNWLIGTSANNVLDGKAGADHMFGGGGNDTYFVDDAGDVVNEPLSTGGVDWVLSSVSRTLGANQENLGLIGAAAINGIGNGLDNKLYGNAAANALNGKAGADDMRGGDGSDTYYVDSLSDVVTESSNATGGYDAVYAYVTFTLGAYQERLVLSGALAINGTGNGLDNTLVGNAAANVLDGRAGNDTMIGGLGNDQYYVDRPGDVVTELSGGGIDRVYSTLSRTLGPYQDHLMLLGTAVANGTGNDLSNILEGNSAVNVLDGRAGNDVLIGGWGADRMYGGDGDDTYHVRDAGDVVIEASSAGGRDAVESYVTVSLAPNVEGLYLKGVSAINGYGNGLANDLYGNDAANVLNGGGGADYMVGRGGNDTYHIDQTGDVVFEQYASGGTDTLYSSVSRTLGQYQENLYLTGTAAIDATGNALDNELRGNSAANVLTGLGGNDLYVVQNAGDKVVEAAGGGTDKVYSTISWTIGAYVEELGLTGAAAINGTGNWLANRISGNSGINGLNGRGGNDTLAGNLGRDVFRFDTTPNAATNSDTILDFNYGGDEWIELDNAVYTGLGAPGTLAAAAFLKTASATAAETAAHRVIYNATTGALYYDSDGVGGADAVQFATLQLRPADVTNADFVVV